jgi:ABC-type nitrate/sulfonate/bicarbonate transport system ATPase subunit
MDGHAAARALGDAMADVVLHLRIDSKTFHTDHGGLAVLGRIELTLSDREIVAIVGPSGCGKTTLLRIIGGLDKDFAGEIVWRSSGPPRIGNVFQEPRLLPWRTVRENILLAQRVARPADADELLDKLGLTPFRDVFPGRLSLGMARRVAIARAFAIEPELVLLDEPFVSLDPAMAERSREVLLDAWHARPITALIVTHDHDEAARLADRILVMGGQPACITTELAVPQAEGMARARGIAR